jgi:lipoprotein-releasing system permease protein
LSFSKYIADRIQKPNYNSFSGTVYRIGIGITALGIALLIIAFSIFQGFKTNIQQKISSLYPKVVFKSTESDTASIQLSEAFYKAANGYQKHELQLTAQKGGILKTKTAINGAILYGLGKNFDHNKLKEIQSSGTALSYKKDSYSTDIWISESLANTMELGLNQSLICYFIDPKPRARKLKIVGIYKTHIERFDQKLILCDLALLQHLNAWSSTQGSQIELRTEASTSNESIFKMRDSLGFNTSYQTRDEAFVDTLDWLQILDQNMLLFIIIISIVASFNLVAVLLVLILEKVPTIGLLKALGSTPRQLNAIFYRIGFKIVFWGMLLGNVIGLFLCFMQKLTHIAPLNEENYYIGYIPIEIHWNNVLLINIGAILLASIVLLLPTISLRNINPAKALSFGK